MTGPLTGIVIADLTQAWAGTYATQLLADLGATVIKIESRRRLDPWRGAYKATHGIPGYPLDGPGERPYNRNFLHNSVNRNKLGITLDLSSEEGKRLFIGLVKKADVVTENFTPRVMPNFGLGYEELREANPRVILLSMPAYGLDGPYSDYPGIGGTMEPMSGNTSLLGEPGGRPYNSGVMYADAVAGLHGAAAVLAALQRRTRKGEGCHMEVAQHETTLSLTAPFYVRTGWEAPFGNGDFDTAPHEIVRESDGTWLARAGTETAPVREVAEVLDCEQLAAREFFLDIEQPEVGQQRMAGISPRLSRTPGSVSRPAPRHGEHSRQVLQEMLGIDALEYERLEQAGITGSGPPPGWR